VVGLVWSKDPKSYAGGSVATGKVSHVGQVKGDDPDEKGFPGTPGLELGVRPSSTCKKAYVEKPPKDASDGTDKKNTIWPQGKEFNFWHMVCSNKLMIMTTKLFGVSNT